MADILSFDPFALTASTTGDYYSETSRIPTQRSDNQIACSTSVIFNPSKLSIGENTLRPLSPSMQQKVSAKRNLDLGQSIVEPKD